MVDQSARTNHAQLVGMEDGTTFVHQYDWAGFFQSYFRRGAFDGIKSIHHLVFSSAKPGTAVVREFCNAEEKTLTLLKKDHQGWKPRPDRLPNILPPPGLSMERRRYLYERIREFVPDPHKDTVCPPSSLTTSHTHHTNHTYPIFPSKKETEKKLILFLYYIFLCPPSPIPITYHFLPTSQGESHYYTREEQPRKEEGSKTPAFQTAH